MPDIILRLHPFADRDHAEKVATSLKEAGTVNYIDASSGDTVNVTVGDVTVEDSANA